MHQIYVGSTEAINRRVYLFVVAADDGITPATEEAGGQPQVSVNGGAWTSTGIGVLVAIGSGHYYAELDASLLTTLATTIAVRYAGAATAEAICETVQVVPNATTSLIAIESRTALIPDSPAVAGEAETARASLSAEIALIVPPAGTRSISLSVLDASDHTTPVPNVVASVYGAAGAFITRQTTDTDGEATLMLDDGAYEVRLYRAGWSFTAQDLTVAADASVSYEGTAFVCPSEPSAPDLCVVYDWLVDAEGEPVEGAKIRIRARTPGAIGSRAGTSRQVEVETDATGLFEVELVQGAVVEITAPDAGLSGAIRTVPVAATQQLSAWSA